MIIHKVKLKNIRSYEDAEIEFPDGSVILSGDIGSGKTSVLLAIEFALFGLQPGQKGASLLRSNKEEGSVTLEFEVDGKHIILERGLKRAKSVNQSHATLSVDDSIKNLSVTELKNFVLTLLNYPKEFAKKTNLLYKFTVYTPQEEMKQIILEDPEVRLDTLRHIFGIDKYKRIKENTDIVTAKLREQAREYTGMIKDIEDKKASLEQEKMNIKNLEKQQIENKSVLHEKKSAREMIEREIKQVEDKIEEKKRYEKEEEKTRIMLIGKQEQLRTIIKDKLQLENQVEESKALVFNEKEFSLLLEKISELEKLQEQENKVYVDILSKINSLKSKISESEKLKSQISVLKMCPTCFQTVDQSYKQNVLRKFEEDVIMSEKKIIELDKDRQNAAEKVSQFDRQISELEKTIEQMKFAKIKLEALEEKKLRVKDKEKQIIDINKDTEMLQRQGFALKTSASELSKYSNIFDAKNLELKSAFKDEKDCEILIAKAEKEIEMLKLDVETLAKEIAEKEKTKEKLINIAETEDWLSNKFTQLVSFTERNVMFKLREEFSKLFNEWFNVLVPDTFTTTLDEDFTPVIEQQDFTLDYSFLSGGERTAVALAYRLALNQVINSLLSRIKTRDLIILDEPTDGFSEQQLDKMRDVLNQLNAKQLIIVSHEQKIESFVENIIRFRKENNKTIVEYK
jgi:exonuclease SbcC